MVAKFILILCFNTVLTFVYDWTDIDDWPQFDLEVLSRSNYYRQKHKAPGLFLNETLRESAQEWANYLAATQTLQHRPNNLYGENIFANNGTLCGNDVVDAFYKEMEDYNFFHPDFSTKTGHFTQLIWKDTRQIGIGNATGANGWNYVVINYDPPGNYLGSFSDNVLEPFQ